MKWLWWRRVSHTGAGADCCRGPRINTKVSAKHPPETNSQDTAILRPRGAEVRASSQQSHRICLIHWFISSVAIMIPTLGCAAVRARRQRIRPHESTYCVRVLPVESIVTPALAIPLIAREVMLLLRAALAEVFSKRQVGLTAYHVAAQ